MNHSALHIPSIEPGTTPNRAIAFAASGNQDAFVTVDRNLAFQQRIDKLALAVVILRARSNRLADLRPLVPALLQTLASARKGERISIQDLKRLRPHLWEAIEVHLRHETSKTRIKHLRGLARPQYRLRVGEVRVFYDVEGRMVQVLAIVLNSDAARWLEEVGERS